MTGGNNGISFTTQGICLGPRKIINAQTQTQIQQQQPMMEQQLATCSQLKEEQDEGAVVDGDGILALQHATDVGQSAILPPTAQRHLRMHNGSWKHPNNMPTNQTSKEHNA